MARRAARRAGLASATVCAAATAWSASAVAANRTLTFSYLSADSIQAALDDGTVVGGSSAPGSVIAPGTYNVVVNDQNHADPSPMFQLTGPGVDLLTDMDGGENTTEGYTETLQPSSTYTFEDLDAPSQTTMLFSTSAGAGAASGSSSGAQTTTTPAAQTNGGGGGLLGSASTTTTSASTPTSTAPVTVGTLVGAVSPAGRVTLTRAGRPVATVTAGRYALTVDDRSDKAGFVLKQGSRPAMTVSGTAFVGRRSETVDLTVGQWSFAPATTGARSYFVVIA